MCLFVDELVLLGNHRDAWVFGAADASSGTAAMMELSRVLGVQLKKGTSQLNAESCTSLLSEERNCHLYPQLCPSVGSVDARRTRTLICC